MSDNDYSILAGGSLIDSMRYGGYRSPAHALAELIDNSFEAGASKIEIVCKDAIDESMRRNVERLRYVAVVDNGRGMTEDELRHSLRFGAGTRRARRGIGRFGMGLPYSSLSQCSRVEVYSWQSRERVMFTYLDLEDIERRGVREVPKPEACRVPQFVTDASGILPCESGTVVVWSNLDRCIWKKSSTLLEKSELLVGRIYRKFLDAGKLKIRMVAVGKRDEDRDVRPNDPLYLMRGTSTPAPWSEDPMFAPDGEMFEEAVGVDDADGNKHTVTMRFALAKSEARKPKGGTPAGSLEHGQHANGNLGISVLRGGRELTMDQNLLQTYDPLERWWGAEIDFPPALDEFFGLTNNKQEATSFLVMTKRYGVRIQDQPAQLDIPDEDDRMMADIVKQLMKRIRAMRLQIGRQEKGRKTGSDERHELFTVKVEQRKQEGHTGKTDKQMENQTEDERAEKLKSELTGSVPDDKIKEEVDDLVRNKLRVKFQKAEWGNSQFFDVSFEGGVEIIKINTGHNAYKNLMSVVEDLTEDGDRDKAVKRLKDAQIGLLLLLSSWARMEDEAPNDNMRKTMANIRFHWGEIMEEFLNR